MATDLSQKLGNSSNKNSNRTVRGSQSGVYKAYDHVCKSEGGDDVPHLGFLRCLSLVKIESVDWLKNTLIWSP